ncbi:MULTISPECIES: hypothetical protein [unclassified Synechococcus]|nr:MULTISPECIES: hypothetical protein [unclassified Synechococcus]
MAHSVNQPKPDAGSYSIDGYIGELLRGLKLLTGAAAIKLKL